ncbi:acrylyl-CoA reductase (NADPH) [Sneathiella chinensis]|uniref:Alcohol dehydrogenase n=1 Tax=Sneathiella chinensis TaxID=349750 RepID=A0ABQ5U397_9PROT|nr:MDR family oxidoreductase [Sneathiella chinensis]GLQ05817.1 alcohol dehydrogenase [Sneathiella chinensis]
MTDSFKALVIDDVDGKQVAGFRDLTVADLPDYDVLVEISYSTLNYKDGLAVCGKGIARRRPMVGGVDLAGTVLESASPDFKAGDKVLVNGFGLSETEWGGYSQKQKLKSEWLVKLPEAFSMHDAMAIGTAGYTSMLCVLALEKAGVKPEDGDILVTGAAGGVGSFAVALLAKLGYRVVASTGREETHAYLKKIGAAEVISREECLGSGRPFDKERWAGAIDSVGSKTLAAVLAQMKYGGAVAAVGLAGGNDLPTTVLPFILRGVSLLGVDSVMAPMDKRVEAWTRLATDLDTSLFADMITTEPMSNVIDLGAQILKGQIQGRVVIDVNA